MLLWRGKRRPVGMRRFFLRDKGLAGIIRRYPYSGRAWLPF